MSIPWVFEDYIWLYAVSAAVCAQPIMGKYKHQYDSLVHVSKISYWVSSITFHCAWIFVWACIIAATFMYGQQANPSSEYYMSIIIITLANIFAQKHWENALFVEYRKLACKLFMSFSFVSAWVIFGLLIVEILNLNNNPYVISSTALWGVVALWFTYLTYLTFNFSRILSFLEFHDPTKMHYERARQSATSSMKRYGDDYYEQLHPPVVVTGVQHNTPMQYPHHAPAWSGPYPNPMPMYRPVEHQHQHPH